MGNKPFSNQTNTEGADTFRQNHLHRYEFITHLSTLKKPLCGDSIQFVQYPCFNNNNDDNYHHKILIFGGYEDNDTTLN